MKTWLELAAVAALALGTGLVRAQDGHMMNGGAWMGHSGGMWILILLVVIVGLLAWIAMKKRK